MNLVCFQGIDKESYSQINALIRRGNWEKSVIIKNKVGEDFTIPDNCSRISVNSELSLTELKQDIITKLSRIIGKDFEVALSIASGTGKEHMALISALLSIPVGIRLVAYTKKGVEFIN